MGDRRDRDGILVCWDGDGGFPGGKMILWWRWQIQAKDNNRGGGK